MHHYRIVGIDQLGFGASSRVTLNEQFTRDQERIDSYQVGWLEKWVETMTNSGDLPNKFFLKGHSYGGYLSSLYASRNQERVQALFLNSPVGHESIPDDYEELPIRMSSNLEEPMSGYVLDFWKSQWEQQRTPLDLARYLPDTGLYYAIKKVITEDLEGFPEEHIEKYTNYNHTILQYGEKSDNEKAITAAFKYGAYAIHPTTSCDRLGNPDLRFPIAFLFGDRDWIGSEGADYIIRRNRFFERGLSQIFIIPDADHLTYFNNGDAVVEKMVGFFNRTIRHEFELKPRTSHPLKRRVSIPR